MGVDPSSTATLGGTAVAVTRLGMGSAPLGGWPDALTDEQAEATVRRAWERGLRYFDTAPFYGYGASESRLGSVLATLPRDQFTLSTKVGRLLLAGADPDPFFEGAAPFTPVFDFSYEGTMRSLEESRERLGFERIDVALIHDPDDHHDEALAGAYRALRELREQGIVGAIGAGMNYAEPLTRFAREGEFDCFLLAGRYTLLEQHSLDSLLPAVVDRGMSIIAGGVYNSGLLADPKPGATYDYASAPADLVMRALQIKSVCDEHGVPLRAAAIQFPLAHPAVATVVIGARTPAEIDDNIAMLGWDIPAALWDALKQRDLLRADAPVPP